MKPALRLALAVTALLAFAVSPVPMAAAPATPDAAPAADAGVHSPSLITALSQGPAPGEVAVTTAGGRGWLLRDGKRTPLMTVDPNWPWRWVPGTSWLLGGRTTRMGSGGDAVAATTFWLQPASGGPALRLPACLSEAGPSSATAACRRASALPACLSRPGPQVLPGAVAYWCGGRLEVVSVPTAAASAVLPPPVAYPVPAPTTPIWAFAVDPSGQYVAVASGTGTHVYRLSDGRPLPGAITDGIASHLAWAGNGDLAVATGAGTFLWNPGIDSAPFLRAFPQAPGGRDLQWTPGGNAVLALERAGTGMGVPSYKLYLLATDGSARVLLQGRLGYVLRVAQSAAGITLWREEGVAASIYTDSYPGPGPFSLQAIPIHVPAPTAISPAVAAAESARFHHLIVGVTAGPAPGEVTVERDGMFTSAVVANGRVADVAPTQGIPDSPWLWTTAGSGPGHPGTTYVSNAPGGKPYAALPACASIYPGSRLLPHAVAYWCGGDLRILGLPATVEPIPASATQVYKVPGAPLYGSYRAYSVNPTGTLVAVNGDHNAQGLVIYRLADGTRLPGQFPAGSYGAFTWSSRGVLAFAGTPFSATQPGVYFWTPGGPSRTFQVTGDPTFLQWEPGGQTALVLTQSSGASPWYRLYRLGTDGTATILMQGHFGYVVGLDAADGILWREEGVLPTIYDCTTAVTPCGGNGPFWLQAVPIPPAGATAG